MLTSSSNYFFLMLLSWKKGIGLFILIHSNVDGNSLCIISSHQCRQFDAIKLHIMLPYSWLKLLFLSNFLKRDGQTYCHGLGLLFPVKDQKFLHYLHRLYSLILVVFLSITMSRIFIFLSCQLITYELVKKQIGVSMPFVLATFAVITVYLFWR